MKIVCDITFVQNPLSASRQNRYNRHIYSLGALAQQLGNQIVVYNGQVPLSQLFNDFQPELYIGKASCIQNLVFNADCKTVVLLDENEKYLNNNPDLVVTMGDYEYSGDHIYQLPAVNAITHINGKPRDEFASDLIYIGNRLPEKEEQFRRLLFPAFKNRRVKVFSSAPFLPWTAECLGVINEEDKKSAYKSARYSLHLPALHVSARPFEILAAGGFCIAPHNDKLKEIFEDRIHYIESIDDLPDPPDTAKQNMRWIMMNHTYLQRWNEIYARIT